MSNDVAIPALGDSAASAPGAVVGIIERAVVCVWQGERVEGLPTGTVTFLFTDIVGSTRRWEEHGEQMAAALARHDVLLSAAIEEAGGTVLKHTGDGVLAVFRSAAAAVAAAVSAQQPWRSSRGGASRSRCGWACTRARRSRSAATTSVRR